VTSRTDKWLPSVQVTLVQTDALEDEEEREEEAEMAPDYGCSN
jgi:hypothetical protein